MKRTSTTGARHGTEEAPVTLYRFDSPAMELALRAVLLPVLIFGILGIAWAFENEAASVVAISLVSASVIYFLEWFGREKLILSDDTNRVESEGENWDEVQREMEVLLS